MVEDGDQEPFIKFKHARILLSELPYAIDKLTNQKKKKKTRWGSV